MSAKLEKYKARKTDINVLLLHTLSKMVQNKAIFEKYSRGIEETDRIHVSIAEHVFKEEMRDH